MARQVLVNGRPVGAGPIDIRVGEPLWLTLTLTDVDATPGDKWSATALSGGLNFTPHEQDVPAGAVSPVNMVFDSTAGFTQMGTCRVNIQKLVGAGANPRIPEWRITFTVAAPAAATPPPAGVTAAPVAAPAAAPAATAVPAGIPQPFQVQVTGGTPPPAGGLIGGMSLAIVLASAFFLAILSGLLWLLIDTISLTNAHQVGANTTPSQQEGVVIENYDITLTAKPGGRIVAGENATELIREMKAAQATKSP